MATSIGMLTGRLALVTGNNLRGDITCFIITRYRDFAEFSFMLFSIYFQCDLKANFFVTKFNTFFMFKIN